MEPSEEWQKVNAIRQKKQSSSVLPVFTEDDNKEMEDGVYNAEKVRIDVEKSISDTKYCCSNISDVTRKSFYHMKTEVHAFVSVKTTFAVVTFTSCQAAGAARHCLADKQGEDTWTAFDPLPVPPLVDAPLFACGRGCCRPTTININKNHQLIRRIVAFVLLVIMFVFSMALMT